MNTFIKFITNPGACVIASIVCFCAYCTSMLLKNISLHMLKRKTLPAYCTKCVRKNHHYEVTLRLAIDRDEDLIYLISKRPLQTHTTYPVLATCHEDAKFVTDALAPRFWQYMGVICFGIMLIFLLLGILCLIT